MTGLSVLLFGFLLGVKHATEADHLAAVATLASDQTSLPKALRQGVAWGIGHALTLTLFGGLVLALGKSLPPQVEPTLETAVGVMLVLLGLDVLRRLFLNKIHFHVHSHAPRAPAHLHAHEHASAVTAVSVGGLTPQFAEMHFVEYREALHVHESPRLPLRALAVGMMHGMAGSAALIVLSLQAVDSVWMGLLYIALFGTGSIVGMAMLSVLIAVPLRLSARSMTWLHRGMTALVGAFSCGLGGYVIAQHLL